MKSKFSLISGFEQPGPARAKIVLIAISRVLTKEFATSWVSKMRYHTILLFLPPLFDLSRNPMITGLLSNLRPNTTFSFYFCSILLCSLFFLAKWLSNVIFRTFCLPRNRCRNEWSCDHVRSNYHDYHSYPKTRILWISAAYVGSGLGFCHVIETCPPHSS